jgi:hypothetical protein
MAGQQPGSGGVDVQSLNRFARYAAAGLLAAAFVVPALVSPATAAPAAPAASQALAAPQSPADGCHFQLINGVYQFVCTANIGSPGSPGSGGKGGGTSPCTLVPVSQAQAQFLGLQWPAPKGHTWETITCQGTQPFGGVTLVDNATGAPAVTPQQLSIIAIGDLVIPSLPVNTAPPPGHDGLVGLPEWFWIQSGWGRVASPRITAGPVWAQAFAQPVKIVFNPGDGQASSSCRGPGPQYQSSEPASAQHTDCSFTYSQPSAGQPNNMFAASVTVLWDVWWIGSGNSGAPVANNRPVVTPIALPVAAGEALVTGQ